MLGGGRFLPVHWGTFNLALHAWDQPAETLLSLAPKRGVELVMPRIGEAVEPARVEAVAAWWRSGVERGGEEPAPELLPEEAGQFPID